MEVLGDFHSVVFFVAGVRLRDFRWRGEAAWRFFSSVSLLLRIYFIVTCLIAASMSFHDLSRFVHLVFPTCVFSQAFFRDVYLHRNGQEVSRLVCDIKKIFPKTYPAGYRTELKRALGLIRKVDSFRLISEYLLASCVTVSLVVQSYNGTSTLLPVYSWNPFDATAQPINMVLIVTQGATIMLHSTLNAAQESVLFTLMAVQAVQAKYLAEQLALISKTDRIDQNLKMWIRQHQQLLRNFTRMKGLLSPILLVCFFTVFAGIMVTTVSATESLYSMIENLSVFMASGVYAAVLFLLCRVSDNIQQMNGKIRDECYKAATTELTGKTGKALLLIQTRCNKCSTLSAYGFYPLCSESFGVLLKATFSFIVTVIQIKEEKRANG